MSRLAAGVLAGGLGAAPALAGEYTTFHHVEIAAVPSCRSGALLDLPAAWQAADGAVVLLTSGPRHDSTRDSLVAALLFEKMAVLERVPAPCEATPGREDGIATGMLRALDAMTRARGAGPVVAVGYGPGSRAVLQVLRPPATGEAGAQGPRYAAAAAIGDGPSVFALGAPESLGEQATQRLAALCRALTAVAAGMGATPDRAVMASVSETCAVNLVQETSLAMSPHPGRSRP